MGSEEIICALLDPNDYNDTGLLGRIKIKTPQIFLDCEEENTSDKNLLNYVEKNIKKEVSKKGFKINRLFLH